MESLEQKISRVVKEEVALAPYNPLWPQLFQQEKEHLLSCVQAGIIQRIEHFGSTSVPGLAAKPIIDMLVEVSSYDKTKAHIVPILEALGYDYFWRPLFDQDKPPYYAWFIKRDSLGKRTHHIHMVERNSELWDRLLFRDYLRQNPSSAQEYSDLKMRLSQTHANDRVAYTKAKTAFICRIMDCARLKNS